MKAQVKINQNLSLEIEAADQKTLFQEMAKHQEVFSHTNCGACNSPNIRHVVRKVTQGKKNYEYFEIHCQKCRARLAFGLHQEGGTLFPKKKDEAGNWLPNNGWVRFEGNKEE